SHWGGRTIDEVVYPSMKVAVADSHQRHSGKRDMYYAYPDARQPLLLWDGSVSTRRTGDANPGYRPLNPSSKYPDPHYYAPDPGWESPTLSGGLTERVLGYYKWTRAGLKGIDYGGREISTAKWPGQ